MDARVKLALEGALPLDELDFQQQEEYLDEFEKLLCQPSQAEDDFFAERQRRGVGVGMDESGRLVREKAVEAPSMYFAPLVGAIAGIRAEYAGCPETPAPERPIRRMGGRKDSCGNEY